MSRPTLLGRRVHIAGSIDCDASVATTAAVDKARELLRKLVPELMKRGATFVIPVDAEKPRGADGRPICFDWLVWQAVHENLHLQRPLQASTPLVAAVQHHKSEKQIPQEFAELWDKLRGTDLVQIENAAYWNMASKRMEAAARLGDLLITIGGGEGVLFLANLYHEAGKPIVPLPDELCKPETGSLKLFNMGLISSAAARLFRTVGLTPHGWINRLNTPRASSADRAAMLVNLLEDLEPPEAFAVRLLDDAHPDYKDVEDYFDGVVKPVIESEYGFVLRVVDGKQAYEHARIDQEIFAKLRRSRLVLADLTAERPNCYLETGFAIGRELPTVLMCKKGSATHFDLKTVATHFWDTSGSLADRRRLLREHLAAVHNRPLLVPSEPLVS